MRPILPLRCRAHGLRLTPDGGGEDISADTHALACEKGCEVPVLGGIPRFVDQDNYAAAFGRQWNTYRKTQLDSYTGTTISRDRLSRCLGGSMEVVRDKLVLEAGCGAGRFTERLLESGAAVFACDLSPAVEANYENFVGGRAEPCTD